MAAKAFRVSWQPRPSGCRGSQGVEGVVAAKAICGPRALASHCFDVAMSVATPDSVLVWPQWLGPVAAIRHGSPSFTFWYSAPIVDALLLMACEAWACSPSPHGFCRDGNRYVGGPDGFCRDGNRYVGGVFSSISAYEAATQRLFDAQTLSTALTNLAKCTDPGSVKYCLTTYNTTSFILTC